MKKFLHKLTMGNCSQLLILEARGIMGAIEILGQIDYLDVIGIPRHWQSNGHLLALPSPFPIFPRNSTQVHNTEKLKFLCKSPFSFEDSRLGMLLKWTWI